MNILIVSSSIIPAHLYGGIERVIWDLGSELTKLGHAITYMVNEGSSCSFAKVLTFDKERSLSEQIPEEIDIVHLNYQSSETFDKPHVVTQHGNTNDEEYQFNRNTIFVSRDHANRHGSNQFVYNGLNWDAYPKPTLVKDKSYFHFLGKASWRLKNVTGAINIVRAAGEKLTVMGGNRLNLKMGFRFTPYPSVKFAGMVDNVRKSAIMDSSNGLVFPVRWHEPFGLALTESLYFGCPVIGTPYGSLPELINKDVGFLSAKSLELTDAVRNISQFSVKRCHEYARDIFNSKVMAQSYLQKYEQVINGSALNEEVPRLKKVQVDKFLPFY
ncbi:glycosyltransferase [Carboxylicivirga sp. N1Y90]|uniref:glycosyltransferase n=1 Tax=Carboxylicivirga fragile TaxID=3417571 RepID=UPI003D34C91D|nr:glycosyltransferase [Marinilabiliaceae bacterium N1Y90]